LKLKDFFRRLTSPAAPKIVESTNEPYQHCYGKEELSQQQLWYIGQLERAQRTIRTHPYFLLQKGPAPEPCPVHAKDWGLILSVDDDYWIEYPMEEHPGCKCRVRQMNKREHEKLTTINVKD
jgi:hypothetical protein